MAKKLLLNGSDEVVSKYAIKDSHGTDLDQASLQEQINNLVSLDRYMSDWNAQTGLAMSNPPQSPYTYPVGAYFIISVVDLLSQYNAYDSSLTYNTGDKVTYNSATYLCNEDGVTGDWDGTKWTAHTPKNYKPFGSTYTIGVASETVETDTIAVGDRYYFDGTNWVLLKSQVDYSAFAQKAGNNTFTGTNTFSNGLKIGQYNTISDLGGGSLLLQPILDLAIKTSCLRPYNSNSTDIGKTSHTFKDLYLVGSIKDGTNSTTVADIANGTFNVINASDIASGGVLTDAQYALITNGKPTLISGTIVGVTNGIFLSPFEYSGSKRGLIICSGKISTYLITIATKKISQGGSDTSIQNVASLYTGSLSIANKSFPSYPVNPTNDKFLAYKTNGTMGWTDGIDLIEITHSALKTLRDNSQLSPGQQYRITDYTCTTTQFDTQSAGHAFDIIVTADSVNVLNENARAIKHSGDTYFTAAGSKLESWELKYCIDNDTSRFAWADTVNGKGVIYYMKDEFNNECPYDFKNVQFKRIVTSVDEEYIAFYEESIFNLYHYWATSEYTPTGLVLGSTSDFIWAYTFHDAVSGTDASLLSSEDYDENEYNSICVHNNIIKENKVVQFVEEETANHPISLNNIVMYYRVYDDEIVGYGTYGNVFEIGCSIMTFSKKCDYNTFGNDCSYNTFGNDCSYNTFGNGCYSNTFGNYCHYNTFGNGCDSNTFGNYCHSNTFGNYCDYNTLVASGNTNYAQYNIFENGVRYVDLKASTTGSGSSYLQNITVRQGVHGTGDSHKVITETRGLSHDVTYRAVGAEDKAI